jgi:23S rRNA pseudouridine1911/1915/1917 synthase
MTEITVEVTADQAGRRLDVVLASSSTGISRSLFQILIETGRVRVNGEHAKASRRMVEGDILEFDQIYPASFDAKPERIPLRIVHRDDDLVVIDKVAGMVVHPAVGHDSGTLANAIAGHFPQAQQVGSRQRPGIVHRLDKDTSGLIVIALTPEAQVSLQHQIGDRSAVRRYLALAGGRVSPASGTIDAPIGRDAKNRQRMATYGIRARPARTSYRTQEELPGFSLLEVTLHTGRTHQIRVHLAAVDHSIAGDLIYGGAPISGLRRQFLHAFELELTSPSTGERMKFYSELPQDLDDVLRDLRVSTR